MPLPPGQQRVSGAIPGSWLRGVFARDVSQGDNWNRLMDSGKVRFLFLRPAVPAADSAADDARFPVRSLPALASARWPETAVSAGPDGSFWLVHDALAAGFSDSIQTGPGPADSSHAVYAFGTGSDADTAPRLSLASGLQALPLPLSNSGDNQPQYALAPGQDLVGMVQITGDDGADASYLIRSVRDRLRAPCHSFGSHHRPGQDGIVTVSIGPQQPREASLLQFQNGRIYAGTVFRVLLTSPLLAGDTDAVEAVCAAMDAALGAGSTRLLASTMSIPAVSGLETAAAVPHGSSISAGEGSVLVFEALRQLEDHELLRFEHSGIGLGLADGFGRVVLLPAPADAMHARPAPAPTTATLPSDQPPPDVMMYQERLVLRACMAEARRFARDLAASFRVDQLPPPAVLRRLSAAVARQPENGIPVLREWLGGRAKDAPLLRRDALDAMGGKGSHGTSLRAWIQSHIDGESRQRFAALSRDLGLEALCRSHHLAGPKSALNSLKVPAAADGLTVALVLEVIEAAIARASGADTSVPPGEARTREGKPNRPGRRRKPSRPGRRTARQWSDA